MSVKPVRAPIHVPNQTALSSGDTPAFSTVTEGVRSGGAIGVASPIQAGTQSGNKLFYFKGQSNIINDERLNRVESGFPRQRRGLPVNPSGKYQLTRQTSLNSITGQVNPATGISTTGNLPPKAVQGAISAVAGTTSVTLYWDGSNSSSPIVIKRADGTSTSINTGRRSITITGLTAGTQYGIAPYRGTNQSKLGFGPGDSGNPQILLSPTAPDAVTAQAVHLQQLYESEPVYGGVVFFSTPAAGTTTSALKTKSGATIPNVRANGLSYI